MLHDLRYAFRMLRQNLGFTTVAVLALALGIGANTVIFSVVNAVFLRPLPYGDVDRLAIVFAEQHKMNLSRTATTAPGFVYWSKHNRSFEALGAVSDTSYNLTANSGDPERLNGGVVTPNAFDVLKAQPVLGRGFLPTEGSGRENVAIIGHGLWQRRFGGDRKIVGRTIQLNGAPYTVVGVMAAGFTFPDQKQIWTPAQPRDADPDLQGRHNLIAFGRLKPGVTLAQAQADMDRIATQQAVERPKFDQGWSVLVSPLREEYVRELRPLVFALFGAVAFVLMIACANVANLLLARSSTRRREVAIRAALGAAQFRLLRQFMTESIVLALIGGCFAIVPALWGIDLLRSVAETQTVQQSKDIHLDATVMAFTFAITLLTGLVFGAAPALSSAQPDLNTTLKQSSRGVVQGGRLLKNVLVVAEVALALVLLVGAGLMIATFLRLRAVNPGFNPDHVMTMRLVLPSSQYSTPEQQQAFFETLLERVSRVPGIEKAALTSTLPLGGEISGRGVIPTDRPEPASSDIVVAYYRAITPDLLSTLRIPLRRGRSISNIDTASSAKVLLVNEKLAQQFWPGQDPLGKQLKFGRAGDNAPRTIVGVVGDVRNETLMAALRPEVYIPFAQAPRVDMALTVRTKGDPDAVTPAIRAVIRSLDANLPVFNVLSMSNLVTASTSDGKLAMVLFGIFGALALALAAVGIYGVMAYNVAQRTAELGIRMALGANRSDVRKLVVGHGLKLTLTGLGIGVFLSAGLTNALSEILYGVSPTDPIVFGTVCGVLLVTALVANYIPAMRATRIDPVMALRHE